MTNRLAWIAGCYILSSALASTVASAAPWVASGAAVRGDFDGDGALELVVSSPESDGNKGAVDVVDVAAGTATRWTRDTSGLLGGGATAGDYFGAALAVGDFDGDGYDDLVAGAPGADDSGEADGGVIHVIYGSSSGLTTSGDQVFHQDSYGIEDVAEAGDQFGEVLTVGDFDCDGYDDVVVGIPSEDVSGKAGAGAAHIIYGGTYGLRTTDDIFYQGMGGNGAVEAGDHFGGAVAAGNFNGDLFTGTGAECDDLAIASPDEDVGSTTDAGYVYTILGGTSGLSTTGGLAWHQDISGVEDTAEQDDRFGLRLITGDRDGDGYDELVVVVPGDSCITGHGEAHHTFFGSSTGITLAGDKLECESYACNIDETMSLYGCASYSPTVYASSSADTIMMFVGDDVVQGGAGGDFIYGRHGDDALFGGAGDDTLRGGPGLDLQIGGAGDDVFIVDLECEIVDGEVIDGGPGNDEVHSHLSAGQLAALGLTIISATVVTVPEAYGTCDEFPFEEGPLLAPKVTLSWDDLPDPDSVHVSTTGILDLDLENVSADALSVALTFRLNVRGWIVEHTPSPISMSASGTTTYSLDLDDFIPGGINTSTIPAAMLELPTSAAIMVEANITVGTEHHGLAFAPIIYGHLEDEGGEAVVYRSKALKDTYYGGDLRSWRAQVPSSAGSVRVIHARTVPSPTP
jgi:Ca2+-binding RTX toxin-like protein